MKFDDVLAVSILVVIVVIVICAGAMGITTARARSACLAAGYPDIRIAFPLRSYCVKRVDQTDVVVPLSSVRQQVTP